MDATERKPNKQRRLRKPRLVTLHDELVRKLLALSEPTIGRVNLSAMLDIAMSEYIAKHKLRAKRDRREARRTAASAERIPPTPSDRAAEGEGRGTLT